MLAWDWFLEYIGLVLFRSSCNGERLEDVNGTHPIDSSYLYNDASKFYTHKDNNRERGALNAYPRCGGKIDNDHAPISLMKNKMHHDF